MVRPLRFLVQVIKRLALFLLQTAVAIVAVAVVVWLVVAVIHFDLIWYVLGLLGGLLCVGLGMVWLISVWEDTP